MELIAFRLLSYHYRKTFQNAAAITRTRQNLNFKIQVKISTTVPEFTRKINLDTR